MILRVVVPGIGSSFQPGDPDPLPTTDFFLTSKHREHNPWIEADENGVIQMTQDGQRFDPLQARMQDGEIVLRAIDAKGLVPVCGGTILVPEGDAFLNLGPNSFVPGPLQWHYVEVTTSHGYEDDSMMVGHTHFVQVIGGEPGFGGFILFGSDTYNGYIWRKLTGFVPGRRYAFRCRVSWGLDTGPGNLYIETIGGADPYASTPGSTTNRTSFPDGTWDFWSVDATLNTSVFNGRISAIADSNGEIEFRFGAEGYGGSCNVVATINDMEISECIEIEDVNAPYYITAWTSDTFARQQLMNRKAYFELSYDGGMTYPDLLCTKYLTDYKMDVALVWDLTFGDTRRVERVSKAWRGFTPFDEPLFKHFTNIHGGIFGGFGPKIQDAGFRKYAVDATFTDPTGIEPPAVRIVQISGPPEDTLQHNAERVTSYFEHRVWPYSDKRIVGSFPGLSWYLMNPANDAYLYGPLKPLGFIFGPTGDARKTTRGKYHVLQWMDHVTPITGPWTAIQVADEPTEDLPLLLKGNPIEILTTLFDLRGIEYDAASATAARTAIGYDTEHEEPITDAEETIQDVIDRLQLMYRFLVRRSVVSGVCEFVVWGRKLDAAPSITLDNTMIRALGTPSFHVPNESQVNRVTVSGTALSVWDPGVVHIPVFRPPKRFLGFAYTKPRVDYVARTADMDSSKPASGLVITKISETFDYATVDPLTPDADIYGEKSIDVGSSGLPAWRNGPTLHFRQWAESIARMIFDRHGRGAPHVGFPYLRGTNADLISVGDAVILDHDHVPNAQEGRTPTAIRGGTRPYRCISMTPEFAGRKLLFVDEDSGARYAGTPVIEVQPDPVDPDHVRLVRISGAQAYIDDKVQVEFEARVFFAGEPVDVTDPGSLVWVDEAWVWPAPSITDKVDRRIAGFPPGADVYLRMRVWKVGHGPSNWSNWTGIGGPVTPPTLELSNLVISNVTDTSAQLDWSYDESPQVGQVRVKYRDITGGLLPAYTVFSTLAAGSETENLTGLTTGRRYQIEIVLWDGVAEYGTPLTGIFSTSGGKITGPLVITSVAADGAKIAWGNTDASRQVRVEYRVQGTTPWLLWADLAAGTNRTRLSGSQFIPVTTYDVQVSLISPTGVSMGDGAGGPSLTDDFTTLAVSVQLEYPLIGGPFWDVNPYTRLPEPGVFGAKFHANPNNATTHDIIPLLAVETFIGSGVPGTFVEQAAIPAVSGMDLYFVANAANDGKKRYIKGISRAPNYTDSIETVEVEAIPWSNSPTPPVGGGIPYTYTLTTAALTEDASEVGFFAIPDNAEIYKVDSAGMKNIWLRLYSTESGRDGDLARLVNDETFPMPDILLDVVVSVNENFSATLVHRIKILLQDLPDRVVYYTLTNLDAATQSVQATIHYYASAVSPLP